MDTPTPKKEASSRRLHTRPVCGLTSERIRTNCPLWAADNFAGRPGPAPFLPPFFAFMAASPALVRSEIRLDSISASEAMMWNIIFPTGVLVSIPSVREWKWMLCASRCSRSWQRPLTLRPRRSSFQTMRVSPGRRALRQAVSCGRAMVRPVTPVSE